MVDVVEAAPLPGAAVVEEAHFHVAAVFGPPLLGQHHLDGGDEIEESEQRHQVQVDLGPLATVVTILLDEVTSVGHGESSSQQAVDDTDRLDRLDRLTSDLTSLHVLTQIPPEREASYSAE